MISMLVPTMNNPWYLDIQLSSAWRHASSKDLEILIYSNMHTDETGPATQSIIENHAHAAGKVGVDIKFVGQSTKNTGVAYAVNTLAKASKGEFIFYTGDDNYMLPGWDKALLDRVTNYDEWLYLAPRMIEPTGTNRNMYAPHDFGRTSAHFRENDLHRFWKGLPKRDCISAAGPPFTARWIWEAVDYFDERFYPGFGTDPDFVTKIYYAAQEAGKGARFLGVGDSGMYHFQCITTNRVRHLSPPGKSRAQYVEKWGMSPPQFAKIIGDGEPI